MILDFDVEFDPTRVAIAIAALISILYTAIEFPRLKLRYKLSAHRSSLPPGPKQIKTGISKPWLWFRELHQQYGDVVYLQMGPTPTIILGSAQAAWDLLERRGNIYSSRPRFIMGGELLSNNMRGLMAGYTPFWRRWRKLLHGGFMARQSEKYRPIQALESAVLLKELLTNPAEYRDHITRYTASVIVLVTYGRRVENVQTDEVVKMNNESVDRLVSVNIPGKFAVERYPVLKYIPSVFAPWKRDVLRQRELDKQLYMGLLNQVKKKIAKGQATDCWAAQLLRQQEEYGMTDLEVAYTAGGSFAAGVETSGSTLASFFLACAKFGKTFVPKAQAELDKVVGKDRLPTFDDLPNLPYVRAITAETLRWRPVAVLGGTPHAVIADDHYKGMFIPKGSTIIAPLWSIHLNENDFPDPHTFKPERFTEGREYPGPLGHSAFGWGRRICPGMHLASASVELNIARILWAFDVGAAKDEKGRDIDVDIFAFSEGFNSSPLPFPCSITPRSPGHVKVIERDYAEAMDKLKVYSSASEKI
ncbi:Fumitremorgin C synthase [Rhypophila decipiens]|uniref:Fumitremorgin C synthase n=1 Tax=Rhypophila decipiens TaxID=261697 RepID=A0AAN7B0P2_9PEZI|nr:Fumitremorgin C synthase [Rhypophila decipiens]